MKVIFKITMYYVKSDAITKDQTKVAIIEGFFITISSQNEKISYVLLSLIILKYSSFDSGCYYSDIFQFNTVI